MRINFKYLIFGIIVFLSHNLNAQVLEIFVRSDENSEYQISSKSSVNDSVQLYSKLNSKYLEYMSDAYILAGYDSIIIDSSNVKAYFTSGEQFEWGRIDLIYPDSLTFNGANRFVKQKDINPDELFQNIDDILKEAANQGYPFCELKFDSLDFVENLANTTVKILPGQYYVFDSIQIKSDLKIRQHYVETYLDIKKGDPFSIKQVDQIEKKINDLQYVELSRPFQLAFGEDHADLILYLKKKKANSFNGMIGILPNNKTTGKLLITGDVNLFLLNSFGAGELFSFRWQKFEALSQNLNSEFSIPYLFKTRFGVGALFDIEKKDSTYLNTDFTGRIIFGNNTSNGFELFFTRSASFLLNSDSVVNNNLSDYTTNLFGTSYRYSNTDNYLAPRKGIKLYLSSSFGTKAFETETDLEAKPVFQNKTRLEISYYVPLFTYMALKFRSLSSMIYSEQIFDNELDLLGGLKTIRGFDELSLPVSSYSVLNNEIRYIFERESALFVFYDLAYFEKRYTLNDSFNYAMGFGAGLDLKTNAGIFTIVFAVGKQNQNPFQFNSSKIHFGYTSSF